MPLPPTNIDRRPDGSPILFTCNLDMEYWPEATEAEILAQPCVTKAISRARADERHQMDQIHKSTDVAAARMQETMLAKLEEHHTDAWILAQPCVVEALRKAREAGYSEGHDDGYEKGFVTAYG